MRIDLTQAAITALNGGAVDLILMTDMRFQSGTVRLATSRMNIQDLQQSPNTYYGAGLMGQIDEIKDQTGQITGMNFAMSGIDSAIIAVAIGEQVRGRPVFLRLGILDPNTKALLSVCDLWAGLMDTIQIVQQGATSTITVTCEHRGVLFSRARVLRYTDTDQNLLYPGDHSLEFTVQQASHQDIWPAAAYFKR